MATRRRAVSHRDHACLQRNRGAGRTAEAAVDTPFEGEAIPRPDRRVPDGAAHARKAAAGTAGS